MHECASKLYCKICGQHKKCSGSPSKEAGEDEPPQKYIHDACNIETFNIPATIHINYHSKVGVSKMGSVTLRFDLY